MAYTAARAIPPNFTAFQTRRVLLSGRNSLSLPPQRVLLSFDRGPRRLLHYSSNHASSERFSAISFSSGRCTLSDWLSVHEGPW